MTGLSETETLSGMARTSTLIGSREACQILGIGRSTLTYWALQGRISPAQSLESDGRPTTHLWDRAEVERLAAEKRRAS